MIDIYEIYLDIRTFWFSFGLMDGISKHHVDKVTDMSVSELHPDVFRDSYDWRSYKDFKSKYIEPFYRLQTYFGSCIFPAPHISY